MQWPTAGCVLTVAALLLAALGAQAAVPYSCHMTPPPSLWLHHRPTMQRTFPLPNATAGAENGSLTMIVGYKGAGPAVMTLGRDVTKSDASVDDINYVLTIDPVGEVRIDREDLTDPEPRPTGETLPVLTSLLAPNSIRYFWVRIVALPAGAGEVSVGRAGRDTPLVSYKDPRFQMPSAYSFNAHSNWVHNCSATPTTGFAASPLGLGCRKHILADSRRSTFFLHPPPAAGPFPIDDEAVPWAGAGGAAKAVRFMVKATDRPFVRLTGLPSNVNYHIDLNTHGNVMAIKKNDMIILDRSPCRDCLSYSEYRLFTILFNTTRLEVYEGLETRPSLSAPFSTGFQVTEVTYSTGYLRSSSWLHGCQGYDKMDDAALATRPAVPTVPPAVPGKALKEALAMADSCRVVHTFKYRFDSYFALSEEGVVAGSFSGLTFQVAGRRDVHLQLVPSLPPPTEDVYEIDLGFHNYTNLDRGKEQKVASVRQHDLLSESELKTFTISHDIKTGVINVTSADGQLQMAWRDPNPFPLRYFSVCSGSSAGNETIWVFGCAKHKQTAAKNSCSRPLVTYSYSHSQYFSVEREGVVNGTSRTIFVHLRAAGSGHIRLENMLPPAVDALVEVDLSHDGATSIDSLGRRVATVRLPGLLTVKELRGFWVRQDTAARRLEVGRIGIEKPMLSWVAPAAAKFPELRFFSLATSRSVGNGTWFYGCKEGQTPNEDDIVAVPEETDDVPEPDYTPDLEPGADGGPAIGEPDSDLPVELVPPPRTLPPTTSAALKGILDRNLSRYMPTQGIEFVVRLNVSTVCLDDYSGMIELKGRVLVMWHAAGLGWESSDFDDIRIAPVSPRRLAPHFHVPNGVVETDGGLVYVHSSGVVRWESPLSASAYCHSLDASQWPNDQHTCEVKLVLTGRGTEGSTLLLMRAAKDDWVLDRAARPRWHLVHSSLNVTRHEIHATSVTSDNAISVVVTLRRSTPVMNRILIAPFLAVAVLSLLAYWVQEPLPRDKVFFGCGSLVLLVLSFVLFEVACPPGLTGIPVVLELYCYASCVVAASVMVSAIMTALARDATRDGVVRGPPLFLCRLLSVPLLRLVLNLTSDQVQQRLAEDELDPDGEEYRKGSSQLYGRFGSDKSADCGCNSTECSKQVANEARYYWTLLSIAIERLLSLVCVILLLCVSILVK
ncbi:uncharacterized protein LOC117652277 [Thrips palmi]|uniref:Uncharacterized protein LOC117652277 n=1 Tax=Thrips palmi TaxID=161013 RepID=A0A6P9A6S2_THRPL|nr:uncharacterized protein LOC117652277 [Thrips palmi]